MEIIMDYEKKYKEALERARAINSGKDVDAKAGTTTCEYIFPELKESEDERIRKWCISHFMECFRVTKDNVEYQEYLSNKVIPWLEKQGESDEAKAKIFLMNKGYPIDANGIFPTYEEMYNIIKDGLEKQSEQKPQGKTALEAIKEEKVDNQNCVKPADKVKSKFKVGDWVVRGNTIAQILDIQEQYYVGLDINGKDFTSSRFLNCDKIHLWTIQDAKDGDVLSNGKIIVIFKHFEDPSYRQHIVAYIGLDINGNIQISNGAWTLGIDKAKPVTKEQRDLLFQKMKEAGYEWDAEKKELKADAQNSAWSEKDEKRIANILSVLSVQVCWDGATGKKMNPYQKEIDWLKSLKGRVQPKVELTRLDEMILEAAIAFVEHNNHFNVWRGVDKHTVLSALHSLQPKLESNPS